MNARGSVYWRSASPASARERQAKVAFGLLEVATQQRDLGEGLQQGAREEPVVAVLRGSAVAIRWASSHAPEADQGLGTVACEIG